MLWGQPRPPGSQHFTENTVSAIDPDTDHEVNMHKYKTFIFGGFLLLLGVVQGAAQEKVPPARWSWSFSERFRAVAFDNAIDLNAQVDNPFRFTRHRSSLGSTFRPNRQWEFGAKLTNEFRYWTKPEGRDFNVHEFFIDNLYLAYTTGGKRPLALKVGRQNLILGEGFLVLDSNPLDGSRSIYFNAARLDYAFHPIHKVTLFYGFQNVTDNVLPRINDQDQGLIEQDEAGGGFYGTSQLKQGSLEWYGLYKSADANAGRPLAATIYTLGSRMVRPLGAQWSATAEAALQLGELGSVERRGLGGYVHLDYKPRSRRLKQLSFGGVYLSGDDPKTKKHEGWDPLFSRWPKWSESYIYTLIMENQGRVGYWSNWASLYISANMSLCKKVNGLFTLHQMFAPQDMNTASALAKGEGHIRGQLAIAKFVYTLSPRWTGHLLWEHFWPGNFYKNADGFDWVRFELMFAI